MGRIALLTIVLAISALRNVYAAQIPLRSLVFPSGGIQEVRRIVVLRRDPLEESIVTITARRIERSYTDMAVVRIDDDKTFSQLVQVLDSRALGSCRRSNMPVAWALLFETEKGRNLGAVYLDEDGRCAEISGKFYFIERDVSLLLKRTFGFMNY